MTTKIKMKVNAVTHEPPMHMSGYSSMGPFRQPNPPIFLSLFPIEERWPGGGDRTERIFEPPVEKVRIKADNETEREAQIIRPMRGPMLSAMNPPVPTVLMLTQDEFENLQKPTVGDEITITVERESPSR